MENQIRPQEVMEIADRLLFFIDSRMISYVADLEARLDERANVEGYPGEFITIQKTPGGRSSPIPDSWVYTVDYVVEGKGVPIELRINAIQDYSMLIVKFAGTAETYRQFTRDDYGNIIQTKNIESTDMVNLKNELRALKKYLSRMPS